MRAVQVQAPFTLKTGRSGRVLEQNNVRAFAGKSLGTHDRRLSPN
jgi:hypothetical protein